MDDESARPSLRISEHDAQRLIARALELDVQRTNELTLQQLRAVASDVGISTAAFEAALGELEAQPVPARARGAGSEFRGRTSIIALAGILAGTLSGALADQLADGVLVLGGLGVAVAVALIVDGIRRRSGRSTQVELAAWWLSVPAGIMLGMWKLHPDPVFFAALSWAGCASLSFALDRLKGRALFPHSSRDTPTTA